MASSGEAMKVQLPGLPDRQQTKQPGTPSMFRSEQREIQEADITCQEKTVSGGGGLGVGEKPGHI